MSEMKLMECIPFDVIINEWKRDMPSIYHFLLELKSCNPCFIVYIHLSAYESNKYEYFDSFLKGVFKSWICINSIMQIFICEYDIIIMHHFYTPEHVYYLGPNDLLFVVLWLRPIMTIKLTQEGLWASVSYQSLSDILFSYTCSVTSYR